ncbi:hypothetical protein V6N12_002614 [Hibiscus sabdariffa]|uniref:RNA helicase n=1 Tax=Hibiscus sabdariffa TaxID=183260 RepID=A0ABR2E9H8_9ROSI
MLSYISRLPPLSEENEAEGPYAFVMAPTRELAQQIEGETMKFAHYLGIKVVLIVGERRYVVLNQCNYVVLDEAGRMIDMGFEPQVMGVLDAIQSSNWKPENEDEELDDKRIYRTTYMFSSTMPPAVERLARKYLRIPVVVTVGTAGKATYLISQHVMMMKESEKFSRLQKLLNDLGDDTVIVFVNTKKNADTISKNLDKAGHKVTTLHATDVVGRGIDIPDVAHVVNYDMPSNIEIYLFNQSGSPIPLELAKHEASKFKPRMIPNRPSRRNDIFFCSLRVFIQVANEMIIVALKQLHLHVNCRMNLTLLATALVGNRKTVSEL